eukprot:TRINITY_DN11311_c2_g1_i1.p1 TRINITY_DN11311_c2_g1~~TRINITY_DN11311_c2_g1_i1.p1  ORF type:complete len:409 (+),score=140.94 TRINITY_DN11311_c2_g1_i1:109-1335(+)
MKKRGGGPKLQIAPELQEAAEAAEKEGGRYSNFVSVGGSIHTQNAVISASGVKNKSGGGKDAADSVMTLSADELEPLDAGALGKGSSGSVRRMRHTPSGRDVALKEIKLTSDHHLDEIGKEMATLYKFAGSEHKMSPYLIQFYGAYVSEGAAYIALELMDGSLADMMNPHASDPLRRGVPEEVLAPVTKFVLKGLEYLHTVRHLVHRDLKPGNLLFANDGRVKITDFGVSQELESTKGDAGSFVGTVTYMSPERLTGEKYQYGVDIWALGISLVELAMGEHPYKSLLGPDAAMGTEAKFWKLVQHLNHSEDGNIVDIPKELQMSEDFIDFIHQCLAKDMGCRATACQLLKHNWIVNNTADDDEDYKDQSTIEEWLKIRRDEKKDSGEAGGGITQDDLHNALDVLVDIG